MSTEETPVALQAGEAVLVRGEVAIEGDAYDIVEVYVAAENAEARMVDIYRDAVIPLVAIQRLIAFAGHNAGCDKYGEEYDASVSDICNCGYDEALASLPEGLRP